ncbi:MAG: hypothetical protein ABI619_11145 [Betaproteobacteria bacterium]
MKADSGFFTLGVSPSEYRLPHSRLGLPVILLIRRVLCKAFEQLHEDRFNLAKAKENEVTAALLAVIENRLRQKGSVPGFNCQSYEPVVRQAQVTNYNGRKLGKTPDLCFRLRRDQSEPYYSIAEYDGLFVECKPVDDTHPAGSKYCDLGLIRFVCGDYAWAMQEGMMLAYARDGRTIENHLAPAMVDRKAKLAVAQDLAPVDLPAAAAIESAEAVHTSKHRRDFQWLDDKGQACDITIYHLWHDCTVASSSSS